MTSDSENEERIQEFRNTLESIYRTIAERGGKGLDPGSRHEKDFEELVRDVISSFKLQGSSDLELRIGVLMSLLGDEAASKWFQQGQINTALSPCVSEITATLREAIPDDDELLMMRLPEAVLAYINGWHNSLDERIPYQTAIARGILEFAILESIEYSKRNLKSHGTNESV